MSKNICFTVGFPVAITKIFFQSMTELKIIPICSTFSKFEVKLLIHSKITNQQ